MRSRNLPNLKSFSFNTFPDYPKLQKIGANAFSVDEGLTTVPFTLYLPNNADYTVDMVIPELVLDEDGNHPFTNRALNGQLGAYTSKVEGFLRASDYYNEEANTWCDFPLKAVTVAAEFHAEGEPIIVNVVKGESFGELPGCSDQDRLCIYWLEYSRRWKWRCSNSRYCSNKRYLYCLCTVEGRQKQQRRSRRN